MIDMPGAPDDDAEDAEGVDMSRAPVEEASTPQP